ncbi:MAG: hypothetical protein ACXWL2_00390 [Candidatus Chromulinivorax sp.]
MNDKNIQGQDFCCNQDDLETEQCDCQGICMCDLSIDFDDEEEDCCDELDCDECDCCFDDEDEWLECDCQQDECACDDSELENK